MKYQLNIDWPTFLAQYWEKKPVIVRQAMSNFVDPISDDELAGLALEEEIDSRLITFEDNQWQVTHGPFTHFNHLGDENWALIVQSVDHWHEEAAKLVEPFRTLPAWRFDDLMVSLSAKNGSVGPHIDQYSVFIIQGSGKRRWLVGDINNEYKALTPYPGLLHVEPFEPILDEELNCGDMLYIPPGFPHCGTTIETAMSFSIGFRAPNCQHMLSDLADYLLENDLGTNHYSDPHLSLHMAPYEVTSQEIEGIRQIVLSVINNNSLFNCWFGRYISRSMHELNIMPLLPELTPEQVLLRLNQGESIHRVPGLRIIVVGEHCYANGEQLHISHEQAQLLAKNSQLTPVELAEHVYQKTFISELTNLINCGFWYFDK